MLKRNPVTVCHKSDPVHIPKSKRWPFDAMVEKRASPENIIIFSHILMKNSPIFFKFSQELYYIMLKQNPVTVCPKSDPVHIPKSKRWPFHGRKTSKSRKWVDCVKSGTIETLWDKGVSSDYNLLKVYTSRGKNKATNFPLPMISSGQESVVYIENMNLQNQVSPTVEKPPVKKMHFC